MKARAKLSHKESCAKCGEENTWLKGTPSSGESVRLYPTRGGGHQWYCLDCAKESGAERFRVERDRFAAKAGRFIAAHYFAQKSGRTVTLTQAQLARIITEGVKIVYA